MGNPGDAYARHRHNIGRLALDAIAQRYDLPSPKRRFDSLMRSGAVEGRRVILLAPETYMNLSGGAVQACARFFRASPSRIVVIHDEIDLPVGRMRARLGGGLAGHNGLRSIAATIQTRDFWRIRIGVGRPQTKDDVANWVLHNIGKTEMAAIQQPLLQAIANALPQLLDTQADAFMNAVVRATTPPPLPHATPTPANP